MRFRSFGVKLPRDTDYRRDSQESVGGFRGKFSETQTQDSFQLTFGPHCGLMGCTEFLKARVSPETKLQLKAVADHEFLSEAAWLKRLVLKEIQACDAARRSEGESSEAKGICHPGRVARGRNGCGKPM